MDISNDQLLAAYGRVPRTIREFLSNSEVGPIAASLAQKYNLHVDAAGALADTITKTLLGFVRPEELPKLLSDQLLLEQTMANALIGDINTMVFIPLQKKVREASEAEQQEKALEEELADVEGAIPATEAPAQPIATKPTPLPPPALEYAPAPVPTLPGSPVPAPMPETPASIPEPVAPVSLEPTPVQPVPQQHFVHAMPHSSPQPGWHPAAAVHIFVPTHGAPQQQVPQTPVEPIPPQAPLPPETPPAPIYVEKPTPQAAAPASEAPPASPPLTKSYAADPYRESV